jgi:peptidoglycan/xylan/chitin deacetylase (PgdA/CDA1 family)
VAQDFARRAARARPPSRRRWVSAVVVVSLLLGVIALLLVSRAGTAHRPPHVYASLTTPAPALSGASRLGSVVRAQGAAVRRLARFGLPIFCGGRRRRMVALTFDDGPGVYTRLAVKKLRRDHLAATFFLVGKEVRIYPRLVRLEEPLAAFGDHTMTHPFLPALARSGMVWQIAGAQTLIERATGRPVVLFRPPYEGRSVAVDREVHARGMLEVLWNVDSRDSLGDTNYLSTERNVIAGLRPGSIILMHENHGQTIRALPAIFAALVRRRLRAVTVPELVSADPPSLAQLRLGLRGCPVSVSLAGSSGG